MKKFPNVILARSNDLIKYVYKRIKIYVCKGKTTVERENQSIQKMEFNKFPTEGIISPSKSVCTSLILFRSHRENIAVTRIIEP